VGVDVVLTRLPEAEGTGAVTGTVVVGERQRTVTSTMSSDIVEAVGERERVEAKANDHQDRETLGEESEKHSHLD